MNLNCSDSVGRVLKYNGQYRLTNALVKIETSIAPYM